MVQYTGHEDTKKSWKKYNKRDRKKSAKEVRFMKRAIYDQQFKLAAVKLAGAGASSVAEIARVGTSASNLRHWINEYDE